MPKIVHDDLSLLFLWPRPTSPKIYDKNQLKVSEFGPLLINIFGRSLKSNPCRRLMSICGLLRMYCG